MALRTNENDVKSIIETDPSISLNPFIVAANAITNRVASNDTTSILSAEDLREVERWLAAHFYSHRDQLYTSRSTQGASGSFQGQTGMYLDSTQYGQTAMLLDGTGYLSKLNADTKSGDKRKIQVLWLGTED